MKRDDSQLKGWTTLCSDVNWQDYHGMWAKRAKDGSWYVLRWNNMADAVGERELASSGLDRYECDVKRVDTELLPGADGSLCKRTQGALKSCGWYWTGREVVNEYDHTPVATGEHAILAIVEACIQVGMGAPLETFTGDKYPIRVRGQARAYAVQCMRDADMLQERLDRPVNAIGTSAHNYGRGVIFTRDEE